MCYLAYAAAVAVGNLLAWGVRRCILAAGTLHAAISTAFAALGGTGKVVGRHCRRGRGCGYDAGVDDERWETKCLPREMFAASL